MVKRRTKTNKKKKYGGSASYARALPFNTTAPNGGNPAEASMNNMMASNAAQATMTKAYSGGASLGFATVPSFGTDNTAANNLSIDGNTTYMKGESNSVYDKFASVPSVNKTGGSNKTKYKKKYRAKHNKKYNKTKKYKKNKVKKY
jgi:hypothetical protein